MTESKICTCPSGDGSLRWPCPKHPAVEQAGGDERVIGWRERILAAHPNSDPGFWPDALLVEHMAAEIADLRAALAQPSQAQAEQAEGAHVPDEVFAGVFAEWWEEEGQYCRAGGGDYERTFAFQAWRHLYPLLLQARAALAQPSPAQAEQAEAERPEVVARVVHSNPVVLGQCGPLNANDELMTIAQHAASVARWAEMFNRVEQQRDAALARVAELEGKLAEMEKQVAVAWGAFHFGGERDGKLYTHCETEAQIDAYILDMHRSRDSLTLRKSPLYAAPVAQAQHSVPELLEWAVNRWHAEVSLRPLINVHRRALDDTWRQVIRRLGGDTGLLCGPSHDELLAAAPGKEVPQAWLDVQAERRRQITAEGWTPEHDDEHDSGELAAAGAAYALHAADHLNPYSQGDGGDEAPSCWPWHDGIAGRGEGPEKTEPAWWKPSTPRRDLVKACALALAEIERLDRAAPGKEGV
ncbi:TPA: hypothetical protein ACXJFD_002036 [Pseudomonas aeruginosa]